MPARRQVVLTGRVKSFRFTDFLAAALCALAATLPYSTRADGDEREFRQDFPLADNRAEFADVLDLEPIVVIAPQDPLDRSQRLLRLLVAESTPCLGCDAVLVQRPPSRAIQMLRYLLLPAVPPEVDEARRLAVHVKLHDSPDLEYLER
jgi:hypothetical protein